MRTNLSKSNIAITGAGPIDIELARSPSGWAVSPREIMARHGKKFVPTE